MRRRMRTERARGLRRQLALAELRMRSHILAIGLRSASSWQKPRTGDWTQVRIPLAEDAGEAGKCAQVVEEVLDALTCPRSSLESAA